MAPREIVVKLGPKTDLPMDFTSLFLINRENDPKKIGRILQNRIFKKVLQYNYFCMGLTCRKPGVFCQFDLAGTGF